MSAEVEATFGGVRIASRPHAQVEGADLGAVTSILQFPTIEDAWAFWNDPEYQRVAPLCRAGSNSSVVIVNGADDPAPFRQERRSFRLTAGGRGRGMGLLGLC